MEFLIHALDSLFTSLGWGVILVLLALGILLHLFKFILPFWVTPTILGLLGLVFVGSTLTKSFQIKELENQLLTMQRDAEQYRAASEVKARSAETELATGAAETRKKPMKRPVPWMLVLVIFLSGCAVQRKPSAILSCPAPPQLPTLEQLPRRSWNPASWIAWSSGCGRSPAG